jgi:hypothetical protein
MIVQPVPVAAWYKELVCGRSVDGILGSNRAGSMDVVCCECRGLCDELISLLEESYRLWCVVACDLDTS